VIYFGKKLMGAVSTGAFLALVAVFGRFVTMNPPMLLMVVYLVLMIATGVSFVIFIIYLIHEEMNEAFRRENSGKGVLGRGRK